MITMKIKNKITKSFVAILATTVLLTGCGAANQNNSQETQTNATIDEQNKENTNTETKDTITETKESNTQVKETVEEPVHEVDYEVVYSKILDKYYTALFEKWDVEKLEEASLNLLIRDYEDPLNKVGYLIKDIDGKGVPELLIGDVSGEEFMDKMIFDLYTVVENEPVLIFAGWDRNRYYMCSDGLIANEGSSGAAYSDYYMYKIASDGKSLEIIEGVRTDLAADTDPMTVNWYSTQDTDYNSENDTLITEEEGLAKVEEYQSKYISMTLQPFSEYR